MVWLAERRATALTLTVSLFTHSARFYRRLQKRCASNILAKCSKQSSLHVGKYIWMVKKRAIRNVYLQ